MANAKQCDRCGEFYAVCEPTVFDGMCNAIHNACVALGVAQDNAYTLTQQIIDVVDLCPKCQDSLKNWILEKETNNEND